MIMFVFPGQGSQTVGMGKELYDSFSQARDVFHEVDDVLNKKLSTLIFEGPAEALTLTQNAQPALMTVSLAVMRVLTTVYGFSTGTLGGVAGHSLGEYIALAAAGTFSLADTARLLHLRGTAMQQAVSPGVGSMAAVLGLDLLAVEALVHEAAGDDVCAVANDNALGQVVISGHKDAVERAIGLAQKKGAKRCIFLNVSAPFHCLLMEPAAKIMAEALENTPVHKPEIPVIFNVGAKLEKNIAPEGVKKNLVDQITQRVRWRETMEEMAAQSTTTCMEVGAGSVLAGLMRRAFPHIQTGGLLTPQDIEKFLKENN